MYIFVECISLFHYFALTIPILRRRIMMVRVVVRCQSLARSCFNYLSDAYFTIPFSSLKKGNAFGIINIKSSNSDGPKYEL